MSENLDLVRSIYANWERGDFGSVEWAHPEIELVYADGPNPGQWTGLAVASQAWAEFLSNWENWRVEPEEYRELDDGRVLVLVHNTGRGKRSGMSVDQLARTANVFDIHDGRVTRLLCYFDRARALADLGLKG